MNRRCLLVFRYSSFPARRRQRNKKGNRAFRSWFPGWRMAGWVAVCRRVCVFCGLLIQDKLPVACHPQTIKIAFVSDADLLLLAHDGRGVNDARCCVFFRRRGSSAWSFWILLLLHGWFPPLWCPGMSSQPVMGLRAPVWLVVANVMVRCCPSCLRRPAGWLVCMGCARVDGSALYGWWGAVKLLSFSLNNFQ